MIFPDLIMIVVVGGMSTFLLYMLCIPIYIGLEEVGFIKWFVERLKLKKEKRLLDEQAIRSRNVSSRPDIEKEIIRLESLLELERYVE